MTKEVMVTRCGVTGPSGLWVAVGYEISHWVDGRVTADATAQAREAEGLKALAKSLQTTGYGSVLDRVLSHLSERTQYAVRQQLKGSGSAYESHESAVRAATGCCPVRKAVKFVEVVE